MGSEMCIRDRVKPDFKKLGPKFGKQMKAAAAALTSLSQAEIASLEAQGFIELTLDGNSQRVELAEVAVMSEVIP